MHALSAEVREEWLEGIDPLADDEAALRSRIDALRVRLAALDLSGEPSS